MTNTPEQILDNLRQRIEDGDNTVTPEELQQAETAVQFTRLQTTGQEKRDAAAAHQAKLDELDQIRQAIAEDAPFQGEALTKLLAAAEKAMTAFIKATLDRNKRIAQYVKRIKALELEGSVSQHLETYPGGVGTDALLVNSEVIDRLHAGQILTELLEKIGRDNKFEKDAWHPRRSSMGSPNPYGDIEKTRNIATRETVEVRFLRNVGGHEVGDTAALMPSAAKRMIDTGYAEAA